MYRRLLSAICALALGAFPAVAQQPPALLPGTSPDAFATVEGSALDSLGGALAQARVRLRDARFGRVGGVQVTDASGFFEFSRVDPGSYVVELVGVEAKVLASSSLVSVDAGQVASLVVRLPQRSSSFAGLLGNGRALAILGAAAASGVLATRVAGAVASPVE